MYILICQFNKSGLFGSFLKKNKTCQLIVNYIQYLITYKTTIHNSHKIYRDRKLHLCLCIVLLHCQHASMEWVSLVIICWDAAVKHDILLYRKVYYKAYKHHVYHVMLILWHSLSLLACLCRFHWTYFSHTMPSFQYITRSKVYAKYSTEVICAFCSTT